MHTSRSNIKHQALVRIRVNTNTLPYRGEGGGHWMDVSVHTNSTVVPIQCPRADISSRHFGGTGRVSKCVVHVQQCPCVSCASLATEWWHARGVRMDGCMCMGCQHIEPTDKAKKLHARYVDMNANVVANVCGGRIQYIERQGMEWRGAAGGGKPKGGGRLHQLRTFHVLHPTCAL